MAKKEKSEKLLEEINKKLDIMIEIQILEKSEDDQLKILKRLGYSSKEASEFTGISYSSIRHRKGWKE
ncbi:hypothetical protein NZNM25_03050 [Nitrosopumilus zosterae]|uniref:Transcriptional regulator n=1 Tax=Nitrosopumilus zosterae TaxID=718286 RepID=A0A2S2KPI6_9ARCH|nr:hypothetical protein [Nitrosopumilus zosterae]BDQ31304.1 hypothetical protein NZOSNM25_001417 [Nitrosopumilus zosterae]GBH33514.1 hypothetical protein NZNM25_03050 [Nitrosopumilus zosterae]